MSLKKVGLYTATSIVIANKVGTGVFTSLHFQVMGLHSGFTILMLWVIGGIAALLGALCYGEIGSAFPRSHTAESNPPSVVISNQLLSSFPNKYKIKINND